jgi:hypothetical protein
MKKGSLDYENWKVSSSTTTAVGEKSAKAVAKQSRA